MLTQRLQYFIYLIALVIIITGCSGNKAPLIERNQAKKDRLMQKSELNTQQPYDNSYREFLVPPYRETSLPRNVGIILPFEKEYSDISKSIINGIVQAYYSSSRLMANTKLFFYSSNSSDLEQILQQIKNDQIEFLIGPLRKDMLSVIIKRIPQQVSVMALNIDNSLKIRRKGFFQFSLNPEEEAKQVANFARTMGKQAIVITQNTDWGRRTSNAYQKEWINSGGEILDNIVFDKNETNFSKIITETLHITQSHFRKNTLEKLLQEKVKFEARRRQDIDVILLATDHDDTRQILPQLRFHKAERLPIFASSRAFTFEKDISFYKDMDGLYFADMPTLESENYVNKTTKDNRYPRLFAFGFDALNLMPYLHQMKRNEFLIFPGRTGYLKINRNGIVVRNLNKYRIKNGKVRLAKTE